MNTHEVINQSTPFVGVNRFATNDPLRDALAHHAPALDTAALRALGEQVGSAAMLTHARLANAHPPRLSTHDVQGRRIDQVEFHPSYHALLGAALQHGLHGTPWSRGPGSHVERASAFMLFTECEPSVLCPVSMTYAVTPALRANAAIHAATRAGLASTRYDARFVPLAHKSALTMGMGMTEKQGGSDVRTNTTRAVFDTDTAWGRAYRLTGHKWFFSAPMCDAFLVLAQAAEGLSCLFVPRFRPDGSINPICIQRLKDKLGNHANASAEVEFGGDVSAWLVGEEGRGVPQILAMGALTRLDCALGSAGLMRAALTLAIHHTRERMAFGKRLAEQPLMKAVLADLALESEAATALALRLAKAVDATENGGDEHEKVMRRVLTPIAKFWICKRGSAFAQEAMECLGGNGYVEADGEGAMARIYREMPVNSIWEGAGNIMALDLLRALRGADVAAALQQECAAVRGTHPAFDAMLARVLAAVDQATDEAGARALARDTALLLQAALLRRHASDAVFAAFCAARLAQASDVFGALPAGCDVDAILRRALPP
ncbi:MAG TPA: isovaleryl-CoA dehydrogenase [Burkholderiaceae bacterium]|nr:isovaleryl-CoA dehydrogenase [Burkholderiaceae bacterium]